MFRRPRPRSRTPWFSDGMLDSQRCDPSLHECVEGFRVVDRAYVDHYWPRIPPPIDEPLTDDEARFNEELIEHREQEREHHSHDVYPCPVHNFALWQKFMDGEWPYAKSARRRAADDDGPAPGSRAAKLMGLDEPEQTALEMPYRADVDG